MVSSPYYDELKTFMADARANQTLAAWTLDHVVASKSFTDALTDLKNFRQNHGFEGETAEAINRWVDRSITRIERYQKRYKRGYGTYALGREVMA